MAAIDEIVRQVTLVLEDRLSIRDFGDWATVSTWDVLHAPCDQVIKELMCGVQSKMTAFDLGQIDEKTLRQELANAIQSFRPPPP